jgi:hypothetical protein
MRLEDIVKEWAELGKQDLANAQFLLTMRPVPLEIKVLSDSCSQLNMYAVRTRYRMSGRSLAQR